MAVWVISTWLFMVWQGGGAEAYQKFVDGGARFAVCTAWDGAGRPVEVSESECSGKKPTFNPITGQEE